MAGAGPDAPGIAGARQGVPLSADLIVQRPEGLYCPPGDFYIDPWRPVQRAVITHAHADHARAGHGHYLAAAPAEGVLRARLGSADLKQRQAMATQGMAALMRSDWNAAIAAYQPLLAAGEDGEVLKRLAWAATNAGRHDEAIDYADRALKIMPASADALHLAGLARINAGRDVGRGRELVNQAVAAEPENPRFRRSLELATAAAR